MAGGGDTVAAAIAFVLIGLGCTGWLIYESIAIGTYNDIDTWPVCSCYFFDNDTTVRDFAI